MVKSKSNLVTVVRAQKYAKSKHMRLCTEIKQMAAAAHARGSHSWPSFRAKLDHWRRSSQALGLKTICNVRLRQGSSMNRAAASYLRKHKHAKRSFAHTKKRKAIKKKKKVPVRKRRYRSVLYSTAAGPAFVAPLYSSPAGPAAPGPAIYGSPIGPMVKPLYTQKAGPQMHALYSSPAGPMFKSLYAKPAGPQLPALYSRRAGPALPVSRAASLRVPSKSALQLSPAVKPIVLPPQRIAVSAAGGQAIPVALVPPQLPLQPGVSVQSPFRSRLELTEEALGFKPKSRASAEKQRARVAELLGRQNTLTFNDPDGDVAILTKPLEVERIARSQAPATFNPRWMVQPAHYTDLKWERQMFGFGSYRPASQVFPELSGFGRNPSGSATIYIQRPANEHFIVKEYMFWDYPDWREFTAASPVLTPGRMLDYGGQAYIIRVARYVIPPTGKIPATNIYTLRIAFPFKDVKGRPAFGRLYPLT